MMVTDIPPGNGRPLRHVLATPVLLLLGCVCAPPTLR